MYTNVIMEPTNNEINTGGQSEATISDVVVVSPVPDISEQNFSEDVVNVQQEELQTENYFDRNIISITILFCLVIFPFSIVISILLGVCNFRNKRSEIFRGIGYFFLGLLILGLVGFGLCLAIIAR